MRGFCLAKLIDFMFSLSDLRGKPIKEDLEYDRTQKPKIRED